MEQKSELVTDVSTVEVRETITDLLETIKESGIVGLAAPQVGRKLRVFITDIKNTLIKNKANDDQTRVFINPVIIRFSSEETEMFEGCVSVAHGDFFAPVKRPKKVMVKALNEKGEEISLEAGGLLARVIQHEYDHLEGLEFVEKISNLKKAMSREEYIRMRKEQAGKHLS